MNACQRSLQWFVAVHLLEKMRQQRLQGATGQDMYGDGSKPVPFGKLT